jgi:O-antigen ligase
MAITSTHTLIILCILVLIILFSKDKVERYLQSVLVTFILMDFAIPPGGLGIKLFDALTLILLPFFLKSTYFKSIKFSQKIKISIFFLLVILVVGSYNSIDTVLSYIRLWQQINFFIFFLIFCSYINVRQNLFKIKNYIVISIFSCLIFTAIQVLLGVKFTLYSYLNSNVTNQGLRFPGPFHDPQKFAQYLAMAAFLFFAYSTVYRKMSKRYLIYGGIATLTILVTGSRAALFGLTIGLAFFSIVQAFKTRKLINVFMVGTIGIATFIFSENILVFKRLETSQSDLAYRVLIWTRAYDFFMDNPMSGIGAGSYQAFSEKHSPDDFWLVNDEKIYFDHPESGFLLWLVEYGIIGFSFLAFAILYLLNPFKRINKKVQNFKLITFLEAGILSWVISFITVYSLGDKRIGIILIILISYLYIHKFNLQNKSLSFL